MDALVDDGPTAAVGGFGAVADLEVTSGVRIRIRVDPALAVEIRLRAVPAQASRDQLPLQLRLLPPVGTGLAGHLVTGEGKARADLVAGGGGAHTAIRADVLEATAATAAVEGQSYRCYSRYCRAARGVGLEPEWLASTAATASTAALGG